MISVIICSVDDEKYNKIVENYSMLLAGEAFEIIGIHDATSLCEGYNRGIQRSTGGILIFSHDDVEILSLDFANRLKSHLSTFDIVGVAGTTLLTGGGWTNAGTGYIHGKVVHYRKVSDDYVIYINGNEQSVVENAHALDGLFFAAKRCVVENIQFDEKMFDGFHLYDLDFTFSAYLAGYKLAVCNDIAIVHYSEGAYDENWDYYREKFLTKFVPQPVPENDDMWRGWCTA